MSSEAISSLTSRIDDLERLSWCQDFTDGVFIVDSSKARRARRHVQSSECYSSKWVWCPSNYYSLKLEDRAIVLGAHSVPQLCKACLFENKNFIPNPIKNFADPTNSQYYLVVVQYVESTNTNKLSSELRGLRPTGSTRFDPKYFSDLRLAPEEVSEKLTGYGHNSVSPFGMLDSSIPVVVCKAILDCKPNFIWMGGGHRDLKLGVAVSEFVKAVDAIVLDVSDRRTFF